MLARKQLPGSYVEWNRRWGAPSGRPIKRLVRSDWRGLPGVAQLIGPFGFQPNNSIRRYEYPWAYEAVAAQPGQRIVEVGGGLSGFQIAMAKTGATVFNVDPGKAAHGRGWPVDQASIGLLNRRFGTNVQLRSCFLQDVDLPDGSIDTLVSISVIEHIPDADLQPLLDRARRLLKPGGRFVITLDLFLDLQPFTDIATNEWGTNVSARSIVERSGMRLVVGDRSELYGFSELNPEAIRENLSRYLIGEGHPAMAQLLVLQKD